MTDISYRVDDEDADGVPLVLVHGVGGRLDDWDTVVAAFRRRRPVVRYDLRGHGDSARPPGPYSLAAFTEDHVALLDRLGLGRAHLVGFSLGGLIAQSVAIHHPGTVERLVLLGAVAGRTDAERERVLARLRQLEEKGPAGMAEVSGDRWYTPEFAAREPEAVRRALERLAANDPASYTAAYRVLAESDLGDEIHRITAPTLAMTGENDVGSPPRMTRLMGERIANCTTRVLAGVKHALLVERAELVAGEIEAFVDDEEESP